jgi:hypothetical protein
MASGSSFSAHPNRFSNFIGGTATGTPDGSTDTEGPGQPHDNMPSFLVLAYIMKL